MLPSADPGPGDRGLRLWWRQETPSAVGALGVRDLVPGSKNTDGQMGTNSSASFVIAGVVFSIWM